MVLFTHKKMPFLAFWEAISVIAPSKKRIQDSLGFWTPRRGFRIPGTGFRYLSVELEFWIQVVNGIPDSLGCITDSTSKIFPDSAIRLPYVGRYLSVLICWNSRESFLSQPRTQASSRYPNYQRRLETDKLDRWRHIRNRRGRLGKRLLFITHTPKKENEKQRKNQQLFRRVRVLQISVCCSWVHADSGCFPSLR